MKELKQTRVLIVEDDRGSALKMKKVAEGAAAVTWVQDLEGLSHAPGPYDIAFVDLSLPDSKEADLNTVYRVREKFPGVKIIVVTAYGDEALAKRAIRSGEVDDYVSKGSVAWADNLASAMGHLLTAAGFVSVCSWKAG